jgi:release factor glutamine methyltransferase
VLQLESRKEDILVDGALDRLLGPLDRLRSGEPLQYVLGHTVFMGLPIRVAPGVLIPRPETEELVQKVIEQGRSFRRITDVGTGSGCIAIALKSYFPNAHVVGLDVSTEALAIARSNGETNNTDVEWRAANIFDVPLPEGCDLVISNPPYIPRNEEQEMAEHVRAHEPSIALFVEDEDPLIFFRTIAEKALVALGADGQLWFEGHYRTAASVRELLSAMGYSDVRVLNDISGHQRFICATR